MVLGDNPDSKRLKRLPVALHSYLLCGSKSSL
jgi:hypothetical protein